MDILNTIVEVMTKEEVRNLKLWLNSTNASDERKDIQLFDYLRHSTDKFNEDFIVKKLYGDGDKNSYYRLKNRLMEDIGYNLSLLHFTKNDTNNQFLYLGLYNIFTQRNQPTIAAYYLKKAEKRALQSENFELLDIIYASFIRLSSDLTEVNPEDYIKKRKENAVKLNRLRETDQALAAVTYRLKLSQNFGKKDTGLLKLLDTTIKEFTADESIKKSKSFQTRIYRAVSQLLLQSHNFVELEKFVTDTYSRFVQEKWFDKEDTELKVQMLIYIINSTFKNSKFTESLDFTSTLDDVLQQSPPFLRDKFIFFYYNSLVLNHGFGLKQSGKALNYLVDFEKLMAGKKNNYYDAFILLNKSKLYFQLGKTNDAIRNLYRFFTTDSYKKADESFKLKISVAECIMQYESGDLESCKNRIEQVQKQFKALLDNPNFKRDGKLLKLIGKMTASAMVKTDKLLIKSIKSFIKEPIERSEEDTEFYSYRLWLTHKAQLPIADLNG